jgi:hypothetical protein
MDMKYRTKVVPVGDKWGVEYRPKGVWTPVVFVDNSPVLFDTTNEASDVANNLSRHLVADYLGKSPVSAAPVVADPVLEPVEDAKSKTKAKKAAKAVEAPVETVEPVVEPVVEAPVEAVVEPVVEPVVDPPVEAPVE